MKLLRLKLGKWRGVESREVEFSDGVTLIEGPNEIGKSTIVEALQSLFSVMHSSSASAIKAIQPVGEDVGSSVEAEVKTGDYHFIYSKTYNRDKQATLKILAPQSEQLTGREAHERAEQILEESVDMALWKALLVEQGNEIAGVTLSQSDGLAQALDEAAGGMSPEQDDSDLFGRVQAEYEIYFTLKTGRPKYGALESDLETAQLEVESAKSALLEVETDGAEHERVTAEVRRIEKAQPELRESMNEHEANWQSINTIKDQVSSKQTELEAAQQLFQAASDDQARRIKLVKSLQDGAAELDVVRNKNVSQLASTDALKATNDVQSASLNEAKSKVKQARRVTELARDDERHLKNVLELVTVNKQLKQLETYNKGLAASRKILQGVKIDASGLEELRQAEGALQVALGKLDTATSSIEIKADDDLSILLNGDALELAAGAETKRDISAALHVEIPGVANIHVVPSQSANELEAEAKECRAELVRLLAKYNVKDLADAVAVESRRATAEVDLESWSDKIDDLLDGENESDKLAYAEDRQARNSNYQAERQREPALPESVENATEAKIASEEFLAACEEAAETQQSAFDESRDTFSESNAQRLVAEQEVAGLERAAIDRQQHLDEVRVNEDDAALEKRVTERQIGAEKLQVQLVELNQQLASASPEAAQALLSNARATSQRAEKDLLDQKTQLAILEDRLTKAQANGRFETLDAAEHNLAAREMEVAAIQARAAAAKRLWDTLNIHRNASRKAYVRPLKEGIEQLGKIVFGADFTIELGDDWGLVSRTQSGQTIPFGDLSVGAKEQLGILTRLAAARIVASQGGVPLIIDDALGFSDPSRLKTMGAAIAAAGQDCQVILLTCTPGRFTHVGSAEVVRF
jgi:uncharacterized protein YhaN